MKYTFGVEGYKKGYKLEISLLKEIVEGVSSGGE
jgi:hypothetical protein